MQKLTTLNPPDAPLTRRPPDTPSRPARPRAAMRSRHIEAHAAAWLRSLRDREPVRSSGAGAGPTR
jgi:hypothetical protein